jgi:DNA-binding PadR family transcriptional regulator
MSKRFGHGELHLALLALIAARPMHGYEVMNELARRMGRRYKPSPGSIYPAVAALEADGLIDSHTEGERRTYAITAAGKTALAHRADALARLEADLGVRFGEDSIDVVLARFVQRARPLADHAGARELERVLDVAIESLTTIERKGEQ